MTPLKIDDTLYRIVLFLYFILFYKSGLHKVFNFNSTVKEVKQKVFIFSKIALITTCIVILLELIAPTYILIYPFDSLETQLLSFSLIAFMIMIIIFFHNPLVDKSEFNNFLNTLYLTTPLVFIAYIAQ